MQIVQEPAIMPGQRITFLLDWELTLKCNLDCGYCHTGINGGHDNTTKHPAYEDCVKTISFMFEYVDLYMNIKSAPFKHVVLNVYGGEALHHPDIVKILTKIKELHIKYKDKWSLTVSNTTNAIVSEKKFKQIMPLVDVFTFSYHTEASEKQKKEFKRNLLLAKENNIKSKCIILLNPHLFSDATEMVEWCKLHNIEHLPRQLDSNPTSSLFSYLPKQVIWINQLYNDNSVRTSTFIENTENQSINLSSRGRACCGGRQLILDENHKTRHFWTNNKFKNWHCSVNEFFLFVKQVTGNVYTNKDCKMNFNGEIGPIGNLNDVNKLLEFTRQQLSNATLPSIICKKDRCLCGLCAPKSSDLGKFNDIMKKYRK